MPTSRAQEADYDGLVYGRSIAAWDAKGVKMCRSLAFHGGMLASSRNGNGALRTKLVQRYTRACHS
jgi:hypothetical protein